MRFILPTIVFRGLMTRPLLILPMPTVSQYTLLKKSLLSTYLFVQITLLVGFSVGPFVVRGCGLWKSALYLPASWSMDG